MKIDIRIEAINDRSPHLPRIKDLGRANSSTLGFFPEGAFNDHAAKKQILAAIETNTNQCVGYLLYRISAQRATIVHLCIDQMWRGCGIAKKLTEFLFERTKDLHGVGLKCRRDYQASAVWPRLGFVAQRDIPGRSTAGNLLTYWWRDHGHPTLFSHLFVQTAQDRVPVVIDMNILIDLLSEPSSGTTEESRCLLADWIADEIEICITEEVLNEIDRNSNDDLRSSMRCKLELYTRVSALPEAVERVNEELRPLFPSHLSVNDESDLRHLAWAVAANVKYFVTRDDALLKIADDMYNQFQMLIYRPSQFVIHLDELLRTTSYQPSRLAETPLTMKRIQKHEVDELQHAFATSGYGETTASFRNRIRRFIADPHNFDCMAIKHQDGAFLAFLTTSKPSKSVFQVDAFRVVDKDPITATLARYLAFSIIGKALQYGCQYVYIVDKSLPTSIQQVLAQEGFETGPNGWLKVALRYTIKQPELQAIVSEYVERVPLEYKVLRDIPSIISSLDSAHTASTIIDIERILWPLKVIDAPIPSFIIPIKPVWAQHLFDTKLAAINLFGAKLELALQRECVFYRAKNPTGGLTAPSRVLWYVSKNPRYPETGAIRACSYIDEIVIARPKDIFKRFRRYGIYEWEHVYETVHRDVEREMMAIRFRDTELLPSPVPWGNDLTSAIGRNAPLQSPIRISEQAFATIYQLAIREN